MKSLTSWQEVSHYRLVTKRYKRAKKIVDFCACGSGFLSAGFSSASFGSALTGIGILASVPLGAIAGAFGFTSAALVAASKKLEPKVRKHMEIVTLALAKRESINRLLLKALVDNKVSDTEFQIIMDEFKHYDDLKYTVRAKLTHLPSNKNVADVEKIKIDIHGELQEEFRKKISALASDSK